MTPYSKRKIFFQQADIQINKQKKENQLLKPGECAGRVIPPRFLETPEVCAILQSFIPILVSSPQNTIILPSYNSIDQ